MGIELNNVQLLSSKVEVSEISAFLQTTTTRPAAAVAAPTNQRAVASLDYVDTASKLQVNPKHIFLPRFHMSVMQILSN